MKRVSIVLLLLNLMVIIMLAGCSRTIMIAGEDIPLDQATLDLRHLDMTIEIYNNLRDRAPNCEIIWNVPIGNQYVDSRSRSLELSSLNAADVSALQYLPELISVTISSSDDYLAIQEAVKTYPNCLFAWETKISGIRVTNIDETLDLTGREVRFEELDAVLSVLPALKFLILYETGLDNTDVAKLSASYPDLAIQSGVKINGVYFDFDSSTINLSNISSLDITELLTTFRQLPNLKSVDLTGCTLSDSDKHMLIESFPDCFFLWDVTFDFGLTVSSDIPELDLQGVFIKDTTAFTEQLKLLPNLTFLNMSNCNLSNEELAAIRDALPDVKVVWMLHLLYWELRTDAAAFSMGYRSRKPFPDGKGWYTNVGNSFSYKRLGSKEIEQLQYCTDLVALDIGHSHVSDLSVIGKLHTLKYLVIGLLDVTDISALSGLTNLEYLEAFYNRLDDDDMEVFLQLKSLKYLNVGGNNIYSIDVLKQLTWLDRLWVNLAFLSDDDVEALKAALPNTEVHAKRYADPGGDGWPFDNPGYTEMRALFGFKY
jgi:Leucine-rich repeat (LRR) protein